MCANGCGGSSPIQIPRGNDGTSVFVAFASDNQGADFSYTPGSNLPYVSFVSGVTQSQLDESLFTDWVNYFGSDGTGITNVVDNGNGTITITYGDGQTTVVNLSGSGITYAGDCTFAITYNNGATDVTIHTESVDCEVQVVGAMAMVNVRHNLDNIVIPNDPPASPGVPGGFYAVNVDITFSGTILAILGSISTTNMPQFLQASLIKPGVYSYDQWANGAGAGNIVFRSISGGLMRHIGYMNFKNNETYQHYELSASGMLNVS